MSNPKIDAAIEVLNFYRNCHYNAPSGTPEYELANAINDILPLIASQLDRKDCPMRHANGNCLPCGGFCTAVSNEICSALRNAYDHGYADCRINEVRHE